MSQAPEQYSLHGAPYWQVMGGLCVGFLAVIAYSLYAIAQQVPQCFR
jgi:hypothetical protein